MERRREFGGPRGSARPRPFDRARVLSSLPPDISRSPPGPSRGWHCGRGLGKEGHEEASTHLFPISMSVCVCVLVTQSGPTSFDLMDCSPPGSSVRVILKARLLEWFSPPGYLPDPGIQPGSPALQADFPLVGATRKAPFHVHILSGWRSQNQTPGGAKRALVKWGKLVPDPYRVFIYLCNDGRTEVGAYFPNKIEKVCE